jgi:5-dehydro-2-deoxygluconokinase
VDGARGANGPFEVITMGRIGVDLYPQQTGIGLAEVSSFGKFLGGSAANVAVAAARHGRRTALISRTGEDPLGQYLHRALHDFGVDDRFVTDVTGLPTPVTFCEIFPPDHFPLYFYRYPKAPDLEIYTNELDLDAIRGATIFWATVTGLCQEPSRSATLAALAARQADNPNAITVLDLDFRPMFWASTADATHWVRTALAQVNVTVGNLEECAVAVGTRDPRDAAKALRDMGIRLAVVKQGPDGVLADDDSGQVSVPPVPVDVVNGLGAGDAFGGALCHGLLSHWDTERIMRFANTAGAIVASRLSCSDAMPTTREVEEMMSHVD